LLRVVVNANLERERRASEAEDARGRAVGVAERYSPRPLTEGERWTVEALFDLRRGRYRLRAWARFVDASLERSRTTCRARQQLARQARRWGFYGALAWVAAWRLGWRGRVRPRLAPGLAWWALVWQMLDWHLGMAEGGDGVPRERLSAADAVTLVRFWLVPALPALARSSTGLPAAIAAASATPRRRPVLAGVADRGFRDGHGRREVGGGSRLPPLARSATQTRWIVAPA
jgi:hypothetical protein